MIPTVYYDPKTKLAEQTPVYQQARRVLITGWRGWDEIVVLHNVLVMVQRVMNHPVDRGIDDLIMLVNGGATGADSLAEKFWRDCGQPTETHPADWASFGKKAGPARNLKMIRLGADICIAFVHPESKGTLHCMGEARNAGIPVLEVPYALGKV